MSPGGQPMEGDSVHSRPWSLFLRLIPYPIRWIGVEFLHFIHWVDRGAGRMAGDLRTSPAFFLVSIAGLLTVGLTIGLFISFVTPGVSYQTHQRVHQSSAHTTYQDLEKSYHWSTQDRWRVAHLFVPHKPEPHYRDIQIDSRLKKVYASMGSVASNRSPSNAELSTFGRFDRRFQDFDVRLDLRRPKLAEQDTRIVVGSVGDARYERQVSLNSRNLARTTRYRTRPPRLLVHAEWEFRDDCNPFQYTGLPVTSYTRPAPRVPEPVDDLRPAPRTPKRRKPILEPEMAPPIVNNDRPHLRLDIQKEFLRSASPATPAGARLVTLSARSVYPPIDSQSSSEQASTASQGWRRSEPGRFSTMEESTQYAGIGIYDPLTRQEGSSEVHDPNLPATAEVNLLIELETPRSAGTGQPNRSTVYVRNEGQEAISRIELKEPLDQFRMVVDADPDAKIETSQDFRTGSSKKFLHREIEGLLPGDNRDFALSWIPEGGRRQIHQAIILTHAAVGTATYIVRPLVDQQMPSVPPESEPEKHPALACDIRYLEKVFVGDNVELEIAVRNTGDTPLHNVQVTVDLPDQLAHVDGKKVLFAAGDLPVRGRNQTVLKMSAKQVGDAVNQLQVASAEQVEANGIAKILVVDRPNGPTPPLPETIRSKVQLVPVPESKSKSSKPANSCCCQEVSANYNPTRKTSQIP